MSTSSTLRRQASRSRGEAGSIRKQNPKDYHNLLWLIEKAGKEVTHRQSRLDNAYHILAHYMSILKEQYPEEFKAIQAMDQLTQEEQAK